MTRKQYRKLLMDFILYLRANFETFDVAYKDEPLSDEFLHKTIEDFLKPRREKAGWRTEV